MSWPVTVKPAAATQAISRSQVGIEHHGAVVAVRREMHDEDEADAGDRRDRDARDARRRPADR